MPPVGRSRYTMRPCLKPSSSMELARDTRQRDLPPPCRCSGTAYAWNRMVSPPRWYSSGSSLTVRRLRALRETKVECMRTSSDAPQMHQPRPSSFLLLPGQRAARQGRRFTRSSPGKKHDSPSHVIKQRTAQTLAWESVWLHRLSCRDASSRRMQSSWAPRTENHASPWLKILSSKYGELSPPLWYTVKEIRSWSKDLRLSEPIHQGPGKRTGPGVGLATFEKGSWSALKR